MIPAVVPTAVANLPAFFDNVVRFPLGLAGVSSPAGSPLIGHVVVSLFPQIHRVFTVAVAAAGLLVVGYVLWRRRPRTPAALARLIGWVMTVAILLAPATRVGYLLYPVDFFVWAWLLRSEEAADPVTTYGDTATRPVPARAGDRGLGVDDAIDPDNDEGGDQRPGRGSRDPHRRVPAAVGAEPEPP
jgi:hypothetical protein